MSEKITIKIYPVKSQLVGELPRAVVHQLNAALTIAPTNYFIVKQARQRSNGKYDGSVKFFSVITQKFPTGLLHYVLDILKKANIQYELTAGQTFNKIKPVISTSEIDFRQDSKCILRPIQLRVLQQFIKHRSGILWCATNFGKTYTAALLLSMLDYPKTLFVVHRTNLMSQTKKVFENELLKRHKIGTIGGGEYKPENITVATAQTLWSSIKPFRKINKKKKESKRKYLKAKLQHDIRKMLVKNYLATVELLILDECHVASSDSWYKVASQCTNAWYRYGMSGTPVTDLLERNMRLVGMTGQVIAKVSNETLISLGYSARPTVYIVPVSGLSRVGNWKKAYDQHTVGDCKLSILIEKICSICRRKSKKVLLYTSWIEQGKYLSGKRMGNSFFIHGDTPQSKREEILDQFDSGDLDTLIASRVLYEGADIQNVNVMVNAAGMKAWWTLLQQVGRGLRKKPDGEANVVDIIDFYLGDGGGYLERHSKARLQAYKDEGFEIRVVRSLKEIGA